MKKLISLAVLASFAIGASPSLAQVREVQGGVMPSQSFTVCNVSPVWAVNNRAHRLSRGGFGFSGVGAEGTTVARTYTNGVFVATRRLAAPSYTYLDPQDGSGLPPCS